MGGWGGVRVGCVCGLRAMVECGVCVCACVFVCLCGWLSVCVWYSLGFRVARGVVECGVVWCGVAWCCGLRVVVCGCVGVVS